MHVSVQGHDSESIINSCIPFNPRYIFIFYILAKMTVCNTQLPKKYIVGEKRCAHARFVILVFYLTIAGYCSLEFIL